MKIRNDGFTINTVMLGFASVAGAFCAFQTTS